MYWSDSTAGSFPILNIVSLSFFENVVIGLNNYTIVWILNEKKKKFPIGVNL